jgi:hypothetical protein
LFLVVRRSAKSTSVKARPDFIRQAADSIHGPEVVASSSSESAPDGVDYNYDVVGVRAPRLAAKSETPLAASDNSAS